jgi:hypothetical protein
MSLTKAQRAQQAQERRVTQLEEEGRQMARYLWQTLSPDDRAKRVSAALRIDQEPYGPWSRGFANEILKLKETHAA